MGDPIDPRLQFASSLPPRTLVQQPNYAPNPPAQSQPYYLPTAHHQHPPPPQQLAQHQAPPSNLDPALEQASPAIDDGPSDDEQDEHGDHDGAHETPGSAKSPGDFKRPRACDSCRGLKVGTLLCASIARWRAAQILNAAVGSLRPGATRPPVQAVREGQQAMVRAVSSYGDHIPH